jgi:hypothetical protein
MGAGELSIEERILLTRTYRGLSMSAGSLRGWILRPNILAFRPAWPCTQGFISAT